MQTTSKPTGVVLGKFMPPHRGHQLLVDFARHYVDDLTVMVGSLAREPIPGELRVQWMQHMFPDVRVVHLDDENPQYPEEHPDFWDIWRHSMLSRLEEAPTYLFASEDYGWKLAEVLGATYIPLDQTRQIVPTSGTAVRAAPWVNWSMLPQVVRPYFVGRVCIFGPESTGKSTLTKQLAAHYQTAFVPEYARTHLEPKRGHIVKEDMIHIARGHAALEDAAAYQANRILFSDTDLLTTTLWSHKLFDQCDPWIEAQAMARPHDLYLLMDVDLPWVQDDIRYYPEERASFFEACKQLLEQHNRPYVIISGQGPQRLRAAIDAVDTFLASGRPPRLAALEHYSTAPQTEQI